MRIINKLIKIILLISIIVFITSFFNKDRLPDRKDVLAELYTEPVQTKTTTKEFSETKEFSYEVLAE